MLWLEVFVIVVAVGGTVSGKPVPWVSDSGARVGSITCDRMLQGGGEDSGELFQLAAAAASKLPSGMVKIL